MLKREAAMAGASAALEAELNKVRAEYEARLANMEEQHKLAMHRQLVELTGTADEIRALREEKSKEERVELLRRQVTRRIMNAGISRGWTAWVELWSAKTYAMGRLRECGNKLHAPGLTTAFWIWADMWAERKAKLEREQLEREANSLEAQVYDMCTRSGPCHSLMSTRAVSLLAHSNVTGEAVPPGLGPRLSTAPGMPPWYAHRRPTPRPPLIVTGPPTSPRGRPGGIATRGQGRRDPRAARLAR